MKEARKQRLCRSSKRRRILWMRVTSVFPAHVVFVFLVRSSLFFFFAFSFNVICLFAVDESRGEIQLIVVFVSVFSFLVFCSDCCFAAWLFLLIRFTFFFACVSHIFFFSYFSVARRGKRYSRTRIRFFMSSSSNESRG